MRGLLLLVCGVVASQVACEPRYGYAPTLHATSEARADARYAVPSESPLGSVRLLSQGVVEASSEGAAAEPIDAVHLRLVVSNEGSLPWSVDVRDQRVEIEGHGVAAPAYASADPAPTPLPVFDVPPGTTRGVDLFFPLPVSLEGSEDLPRFDVVWQVKTSSRLVAERTPFARVPSAPAGAGDAPSAWDRIGWQNPLAPALTFDDPASVPPLDTTHRVVVRRPAKGAVKEKRARDRRGRR